MFHQKASIETIKLFGKLEKNVKAAVKPKSMLCRKFPITANKISKKCTSLQMKKTEDSI